MLRAIDGFARSIDSSMDPLIAHPSIARNSCTGITVSNEFIASTDVLYNECIYACVPLLSTIYKSKIKIIISK